MADHFACLDYEGVSVSCDEEVWFEHILYRHPELTAQEPEVQRVIAQPRAVYGDRDYPHSKIYYGSQPGYIRIVVAYHGEGANAQGRIVTAFPSPRIRPGDTLLWQSPLQRT